MWWTKQKNSNLVPPDDGESDENKNEEATPTTEAPSGGQKVKRQAKEEQIFTQLGPQAKLYIACTWSTAAQIPEQGSPGRH